jgi:outer membrane protein assembly factor BamB
MLPRRQSLAVAFATVSCALPLAAADWPQWLGPTRDGVWKEDGILDKLPADGPKVLWKKPINGGYGGPAVVNGRVYVTDRIAKAPAEGTPKGTLPGNERVLCLDMKTGETIWVHEYDRTYQRVDRPMGPRTTPVIDGDRLYTLGSMGDLYCLDVKTGKPVWNKYFPDDYKVKGPVWGHSAHLLVHGDMVYALVGGEGKAVVAFDKATGQEKWSALTSKDVGYSPPVIAEVGGAKQLIVWLSDKLAGLDPVSGEVFWQFAHPAKNLNPGQPAVTIITPKVVGDTVYVSSAYDGLCAVKLDKEPKKSGLAWRSATSVKGPELFPVLMTTIIHRDGYLYGLGADTGEVMCADAKTGKEVWKSKDLFGGKDALFGSAFWVEQGDRAFTFVDNGDLVILKLSPKGYEELGRAHVMDPIGADRGRKVIWAHPAFADKKMVFRNEKEIVCVSLAKG